MTTKGKGLVRIALGISLVVSFFFCSYWITFALALIGLVLVPYYWEFLIASVLVESLYGSGASFHQFFRAHVPLFALCVFVFAEFLRTRIRERTFRV